MQYADAMQLGADGKSVSSRALATSFPAFDGWSHYLGGVVQSDGTTELFGDVYTVVGKTLRVENVVTSDQGATYHDIGVNFNDYSPGLAATGDDKILIGHFHKHRAFVARLNSDGSLDASFGVGGATELQLTSGRRGRLLDTAFRAVAELPDGSVVAAGSYGSGLLLAKFSAN
jgi:hypothetical protein